MAEKLKSGARPRGRPPRYRTPEEMQEKIDTYFESCKGHTLPALDENGNETVMLDKYGQPIIVDAHPPTITGLALALGFTNRLDLLRYQDKEIFRNTVTRAKSRVEAYAEARLFDRDGANGAKFSLANNFKGWAEKPDGADLRQTTTIKVTLTDD